MIVVAARRLPVATTNQLVLVVAVCLAGIAAVCIIGAVVLVALHTAPPAELWPIAGGAAGGLGTLLVAHERAGGQ